MIRVLLLLGIVLAGCEAPVVRVVSESMVPTFQPGDLLVRVPLDDPEADIRHGMVILYEHFEGMPVGEPGELFLFRAMALPGDRISLRGDTLRVNGRVVPGPYVTYEWPSGPRPERLPSQSEIAVMVVPAGTVFVLGDNRFNAIDSRFHGPIPMERVRGYVRDP